MRDFVKGDRVLIKKAARPYVMAGFRSVGNDLAAEEEEMIIRKIIKTKGGRKMHLLHPEGLSGYAIMIDRLPDFMTVEKIS